MQVIWIILCLQVPTTESRPEWYPLPQDSFRSEDTGFFGFHRDSLSNAVRTGSFVILSDIHAKQHPHKTIESGVVPEHAIGKQF
jgi:hypothetical protein